MLTLTRFCLQVIIITCHLLAAIKCEGSLSLGFWAFNLNFYSELQNRLIKDTIWGLQLFLILAGTDYQSGVNLISKKTHTEFSSSCGDCSTDYWRCFWVLYIILVSILNWVDILISQQRVMLYMHSTLWSAAQCSKGFKSNTINSYLTRQCLFNHCLSSTLINGS